MCHAIKILNRRIRWILFLSLGFAALGFMGPVAALGAGPAPVDLGSAGDFAILAKTGITNTGSHTTAITGDIGNSPGTAAQMNGVWCSEITGTIYGVDAAYTGSGTTTCYQENKTKVDNAVGDMLTAYNNAAAVVDPAPVVGLGGGNIGGMDLAPGLYKWSTGVNIADNLTLSGGADDVWIFQIAGDLNVASAGDLDAGIKVILSGGARASNVFWQVGGGTGATLGTYSTFNGIILSAKQIIMQTGAVLKGRALAQTQVTLDANTVSEPCPLITLLPTVLPSGTVNDLYSQTITADGGQAPYTFAMTSGTLPAGLTLSSGGLISGTPTAAGTYTFTITATDANGCTGLREYTLVINAAACPLIELLPTVLPSGIVDEPYSQTITASGGQEPYTFTMTSGTLPAGLGPITNDGVIAGTPTETGTYTFTVTATDANGCTGLREYTLVINDAACPLISLLPTVLPSGIVDTPYSQTITADGGQEPHTFSMTSGTLPSGLSPITSDGVIAGTPTETGTFTFTITATDDEDCTGLHEYTLVINDAPAIVPATIPTLSEWGMIILITLMSITSIYYLRKRKVNF